MRCPHCSGRIYSDAGILACLNCGRPLNPVEPLSAIKGRGRWREVKPLGIKEYDGIRADNKGSPPQHKRIR